MSAVILIKDEAVLDALMEEPLLIVNFMATWCGPCRLIAPAIDQLASDYSDRVRVCRIDVEASTAIAERFDIEILPTVMVFRQGQLVETLIGVESEKSLIKKLKEFL